MNLSRRHTIKQTGAAMAGLILADAMSSTVTHGLSPVSDVESPIPGLIPLPASIKKLSSPAFALSNGTGIDTVDCGLQADELTDYLIATVRQRLGLELVTRRLVPHRTTITLQLVAGPIHPGPHWQQLEAYRLMISPDGKRITIIASHTHGLFNGMMTFLQLAHRKPGGGWKVPAVYIEDFPRLQWRGYMLDVSGMFFDVREITQLIDAMALLKLNIFHWHLTDNYGWRLAIDKYPRLTTIGAWRPTIGFGFQRSASYHFNAQGQYGGFYTRADIRAVVMYAAKRHIVVVPEIEMPGHCLAAVRAYRWLACGNNEHSIPRSYPTMNPGNPRVFDFLTEVLGHTAEMFPGPYLHTGGDEVDYCNWQQSKQCQALISRLHLQLAPGKYDWRERYVRPGKINMKLMEALQGYFEDRVSRIVTALGRHMISWHSSPHLSPPGMIAMDWHSPSALDVAAAMAQSRHQVVRCPAKYLYFDYPLKWTSLQRVYSFNPAQPGLATIERPWLLGAQANLWTGHVPDLQALWRQTFPRLCAAAEVFWTPQHHRNWLDFQRRLDGFHIPRFHGR